MKWSKLFERRVIRVSPKDKKVRKVDITSLLNVIKETPLTYYSYDSEKEEYIIFYEEIFNEVTKLLKESNYIVIPVFAEKSGHSPKEIRYYINKLMEEGLINGNFRSQGGIFFTHKSEDEELDDLISKVVDRLEEASTHYDSIQKEKVAEQFSLIRSETKEERELRVIKRNVSVKDNLKLATKSELTLEEFESLATNESFEVRYKIASRTDLPIYLMERMAVDPNGAIRLKILKRKDLPQSLHQIFVEDEEIYIRKELALNKELTPEIIELLSKDKSEMIRGIIASRFGL